MIDDEFEIFISPIDWCIKQPKKTTLCRFLKPTFRQLTEKYTLG